MLAFQKQHQLNRVSGLYASQDGGMLIIDILQSLLNGHNQHIIARVVRAGGSNLLPYDPMTRFFKQLVVKYVMRVDCFSGEAPPGNSPPPPFQAK